MKHGIRVLALLCVFEHGCLAPPPATSDASPAPQVPDPARGSRSDGRSAAEVSQNDATSVKGLTLDQALAMAEHFHPELTVARAEVEAAEGRALQARNLPNPTVAARIESAPFSGRTTGDAEYLVGVSQRLPLVGRLSRAMRVEELERDRLVRKLEARRLEVRRRVQASFAALVYSEEALNAHVSAVRMAEQGVAVAQARLESGEALPAELARSEIELVRAQMARDNATSLREQALSELLTAVGDPSLRVDSVDGALDAVLEVPTIDSLATRLQSSPLLTSVEADVAVHRARLDLAGAERIPDVNLDLFYRRLQESDENAFDVGIAIPVPLFDQNEGKLREARAGIVAAEARIRSTRSALQNELQQSHARLSSALAAARVIREQILPRAEEVLEATEIRYAGGDTSLAEVIPTRRDYVSVQLAYLDSLREVMEAWATLSPYLSQASSVRSLRGVR